MHQISLCINNDNERKIFVKEFRSEFAKQVVIATHVLGPFLRDGCNYCLDDTECKKKIIQSFCEYGYIPPHISIPFKMRMAIAIECEKIVPLHLPDINIQKQEHVSQVSEIYLCLSYLCTSCIQIYSCRTNSSSCLKKKNCCNDQQQQQLVKEKLSVEEEEKLSPMSDSSQSSLLLFQTPSSSSLSSLDSPSSMTPPLPISLLFRRRNKKIEGLMTP